MSGISESVCPPAGATSTAQHTWRRGQPVRHTPPLFIRVAASRFARPAIAPWHTRQGLTRRAQAACTATPIARQAAAGGVRTMHATPIVNCWSTHCVLPPVLPAIFVPAATALRGPWLVLSPAHLECHRHLPDDFAKQRCAGRLGQPHVVPHMWCVARQQRELSSHRRIVGDRSMSTRCRMEEGPHFGKVRRRCGAADEAARRAIAVCGRNCEPTWRHSDGSPSLALRDLPRRHYRGVPAPHLDRLQVDRVEVALRESPAPRVLQGLLG